MTESIAQRLETVRRRIRSAELAAGRPPGSVQLLAVSKTQPPERIREAWEAGQRSFGENYLQETLKKMERLGDLAIEWHFIGRIQGNKTRTIAERFAWVHGLSDPRHARRLNDQRPAGLPPLAVCLQINISGEASKAGLQPEQAEAFIADCRGLERLRIRGLMAIPQAGAADPRAPFRALRALRDALSRPDRPLDTLSMGMSADLEPAVAEGATIVRIGTAIFGPRKYGKP